MYREYSRCTQQKGEGQVTEPLCIVHVKLRARETIKVLENMLKLAYSDKGYPRHDSRFQFVL